MTPDRESAHGFAVPKGSCQDFSGAIIDSGRRRRGVTIDAVHAHLRDSQISLECDMLVAVVTENDGEHQNCQHAGAKQFIVDPVSA